MSKKPVNSTQTSNEPQTGKGQVQVTQEMVLRSVNRSKKDVRTWRTAIVAAESVYVPNTVPLYDLYTDILLDAHLSGLIKKRISSVRNKKMVFKVGEDKVDEMDSLIQSKAFSDVIKQIMLAKMWGISGMEFIPGERLTFNEIPRKHIKTKTQKIVYEQWDNDNGVFYPDYQNIWVVGEPGDLGLLSICGFYALLKKGAISHWAEYVELYGSPVMVLKYGGNDLQSRKVGQGIVDKAGNSLKIVIPKEMDFQLVDGKTSNGNGDLQEKIVERLNQEMSLIITGNTETSTNGKGGTGGKSVVHSNEQKQLIKDDMDDVLDLLNSDKFLAILATYGYPVTGGNFEYVGEIDIEFLQQKIRVDLPLLQAGLPVSAKYLYETYNIPMPEKGDQIVILSGAPSTDPEETGEEPTEPTTPKPATREKTPPAEKPLTASDVKAMLTDFFANALT
ncbi:phage portal protein family protein [Flavipsychrobacter stenotrophus]|nr:DUF935 family protein [Flavipsychrobacter stenotrophus]